MRVLGIDPGLATTGYALLEGARAPSVIEVGVIRTSAEEPLSERLHTLYSDVRRLIEEYRPDVLAIEELFFSQNRTTAMVVAQARGVVLLAAHGLTVASYTPLQVKLRIAGYGHAKKPQIQKMIQRWLKLKELPKPDDAADALAVALCYLLERRSPLRRALSARTSRE
ncbi:MAG: crossover junction endodeoxyribonuclease RuvC [Candidatus Bipolaricaulota bacterium]|nr:crossover junction endodeoxyribonuclease RuvC [Candidatus Bipolaricaulota bacterium]